MRACFLLICLFVSGILAAQQDTASSDSTSKNRKNIYRGPRTASILSAVLPGAGQVYNRKYWKLPIIYAGMGGLGYLFYVHQSDYSYYRRNLAAIHDGDSSTENVTPFSSAQLVTLKNDARRYRDLAIFGVGVIYLLNIIDANVDAHLKTFDVSDDLSLRLSPAVVNDSNGSLAGGVRLKIVFN